MSGNGHAPKDDKLGPAIAAAEQPATVRMRTFQVTIASTGHPAAIVLPLDATDAEIAEFCGWVLTAVLNTHRMERASAPASGIIVPTRGPLVRA